MDVNIRRYKAKDEKELLKCITQLQDFIASLDPLKRIRRRDDFDAEKYLKSMMKKQKKQNGVILVAEQSNKILGFVFGLIELPKSDNLGGHPSIDGIVEELLVFPRYRGKGIGILLMEKIEAYFWESNCSVVKVDCFGPNKEAHAFYKKLGYEDRLITLIKSSGK